MSTNETDVDPVALRIARRLDAKRRDNAEMLSALKVAEEAWERLNKEVDTVIGQEFDLQSTELDAVRAARDRLEEPDTEPTEEGFVFSGRVFDRASGTGLAQLLVRVVRDRDVEAEPLAEAVTDASGGFRAVVPVHLFDPTGAEMPLRVEAHQRGVEKPVGSLKLTLPMKPGGVEKVELPVRQTRATAGNALAGEAARDSVEETLASVERRVESMKVAHTATTRFSELTRDELRELSTAMASDPPPIEGGPPAPPAPPAPPTPPSPGDVRPRTPLERIEGIGPRRAEQLRNAGITDAESLVRARPDRLIEILGEAGAKNALAAAEKLLAER
jgi:hypothetical protein